MSYDLNYLKEIEKKETRVKMQMNLTKIDTP